MQHETRAETHLRFMSRLVLEVFVCIHLLQNLKLVALAQAAKFVSDHSSVANQPGLNNVFHVRMLPPFFCDGSADQGTRRRHHQERKLSMLSFWRDGLERQLAAINASIDTLKGQMDRDAHSEH